MSVVQVGACDVHVDQAVGDEGGGDEAGDEHSGMGLAAGVAIVVLGALLEYMVEGHLGEGTWTEGSGGEGSDVGEAFEERPWRERGALGEKVGMEGNEGHRQWRSCFLLFYDYRG